MSSNLLQVINLSKSYTPDTSAVAHVSFAIDAGEIICLLGPSGCGKTTLLRMIAGLERPDAGQVIFAGRDVAAIPPHKRDFGMMFQDFALFPHKNVFENVAFGLQMRGDSREAIAAQVAKMLALVNLQGFENRDVSLLSGGEQQRVALARALAPDPRLLMLDEPLGALDRALRERLMLDLRAILKRVGVTAIYVTHDQTEAFAIAGRVAVMNAGRIEQLDTPQQVYSKPASPFTARFLGFQNLVVATVTASQTVATRIGPLAVGTPLPSIGEQVIVLIKPDALIFPSPSSSARGTQHTPPLGGPGGLSNKIEAVVDAVSFRGKYYQLWLTVSEQRLMFELPLLPDWQIGDTVTLTLKNTSIIVL